MSIDQLNNYIKHHKNRRAVALMIKTVNKMALNPEVKRVNRYILYYSYYVGILIYYWINLFLGGYIWKNFLEY